ncbi:asparagine synthase (glutamine-hydrolysing) [Desulfacinum hydrothermale DSM 13146]|uniref:asparagine synthase (glutamine-hydrolyzing) n=1 Tax=Desulfacinum hydrothermale DSM 13146 TaxID=1121390 RepID=A0A1W1XQP3_9BACT|nr:asparagine synthase (glutamine-hydrolyzing) [Desulfacinum hydrothermale]SMC26299.1 asparagine synthase (glutamine-hydrolysing) [Desulfacinum hydrothermale DSM 13146]
MCGIAGILHRDGTPVDPDLLVRMTRILTHRGPDDEGYYVHGRLWWPPPTQCAASPKTLPDSTSSRLQDVPTSRPLDSPLSAAHSPIALGHRRLSIIDLHSGRQPLANEDGSVWVVFNGEIYNFLELRAELMGRGHRFRTRTDTEVIVHAYEEWGTGAVSRFRGMFALALWDARKGRLWLVRDRLGKKPLYYAEWGKKFYFASEIKAILEALEGIPRVDETALSDYLSLQYIPAPKTIYRDIRKLPAGHEAVISASGMALRSYWDLSFQSPAHGRREEDLAEELHGLLQEAVRLRLISDVPLGAFLSGGVDSSAVVALMAAASQEPVLTNTIAFDTEDYDEAPFARRLARHFSTDHHEFRVTPQSLPVIDTLAWHYDEPFADPSAVPTYYVSKMARQVVTVALSGDGGDENFAGYSRYRFDVAEERVRRIVPRVLRRALFGPLAGWFPKSPGVPRFLRAGTVLSNLARDPEEAYFASMSGMPEEDKHRLLNGRLRGALKDYRTKDLFRDLYRRAPARDHLSRLQYIDFKTYLCEDILTKVDRASMAVSLEVRCPILDHVLVEFAAGIPWRFKLNGLQGKHIFKKAVRRSVPAHVLERHKKGFAVPVGAWFRGELKEYARSLILEGEGTRRFLDGRVATSLWQEHQQGRRDRSMELWTLLMLNAWARRFLL